MSEGRHFIEAMDLRSARVELSWAALFRGGIKPARIEVFDFEVALAATERAETRTATIDLAPWEELQTLVLERGTLVYSDHRIPIEADFQDIDLGVVTAEGGLVGPVSTGAGAVQWAERPPFAWDDARALLKWDGAVLSAERIMVRGEAGEVDARAKVVFLPDDIRVEGEFDAAWDLAAVVADDFDRAEGTILLEGRFDASLAGTWNVAGTLRGKQAIAIAGLHCLNTQAHFSAEAGVALLSEGEGRCSGIGEISDFGAIRSGGSWRVHAAGESAAADLLQRAALPESLIRGHLAWRVSAVHPGVGGEWTWEALADLVMDASDPDPSPLRVEAQGSEGAGRIDGEGRWSGAAWKGFLAWEQGLVDGLWSGALEWSAPRRGDARRFVERAVSLGIERGLTVDPRIIPRPGGRADGRIEFAGQGGRADHLVATFSLEKPTWSRSKSGGAPADAVTAHRLEGRITADDRGWVAVDARLSDEGGGGIILAAQDDGIAPLVSLHARKMPVSWFAPFLDGRARWRRLADVDGRLDGSLIYGLGDDLSSVNATLRLAARVDPGGPLTINAVARRQDGVLEIPFLSATLAGAEVRSRGRIVGLDSIWSEPSASLHLTLDADLSRLAPVLALETGRSFGLQGKIEADALLTAFGRGRPLNVEGHVGWNDLVFAGTEIADGDALVSASDGGTRIEAGGEEIAVSVEVRGDIDRAEAEVEIRWDEFDVLTPIEKRRGAALPLSLGVWSSGSFRFGGPLAAFASWRGSGELTRLDMVGAEVLASLKSPVRWRLSASGGVEIAENEPIVLLDRQEREVAVWGGFHAWGDDAGDIDLRVVGDSDLGVIEAFDPDLVASGRVGMDLELRGPAYDPSMRGTAVVEQGAVFRLGFGEIADALEGRLTFADHRIGIDDGRFLLGGGKVDFAGEMEMRGWLPGALAVEAQARDVSLRVPADLHGRYDADLKIGGSFAEPLIQGEITLLAGRLVRDMTPRLVGGARTRTVAPTFSSRSWPSRMALDLSFMADESLSIRTDLARLEAGARLRVGGTAAQPALQGRVDLGQGGQISFRGQDYEIIDGELVFDEIRGESARFRIRATTRVRDYQIQLDLEASSDRLDYQLTSAPSLPRADILSLLLTGQTLAEMQSRGQTGVESDLAAAYFGSQIGELLLAGTARRMLGLSRFEISPSTVGPDADPTARVTLGRRLDDRTFVLYSRDLSGRGRDVYRLERELSHSWRIVAGREILGGVGADLRWLRRLDSTGQPQQAAVGESKRLGELEVRGLPAGMTVNARQLGLQGHRPLSRARIVEAHEALRRRLVEKGYLEAQLRHDPIDFDSEEHESDLVFSVDPGPRWEMLFGGPSSAARMVRETVLDLWAVTWFRPTRLREAERVLKEALADDGFAAASIEVHRDPSAARRLIFKVDPGPKLRVREVDVEGVRTLDPKEVRDQILSQPGGWFGGHRTLYRPRLVSEDAEAIRTLYESKGYLDAVVETRTRFTGDGSAVTLVFQVDEGKPYRIAGVRVVGDWPESLGHATEVIEIGNGDLFVPSEVRREERRLRDILDRAGYQEARVRLRVEVGDGDVVVVFRVHAGRSLRIATIGFEGLRQTKKQIVEAGMTLAEGRPLSNEALLQTERNLYRLGLFRRVEITTQPLEGRPAERKVLIRLEEAKNLSVMVGAGYDSEEKGRASISLTHENLGGWGRVGSLQTFYSSIRQNARLTFEDRHISGGRLEGLATIGWLREEREGFTEETKSATLQIGSPPRGISRWQAIYTLSDTSLSRVSLSDDALRDVLRADRRLLDAIRLASLGASFVIDHRDDPFLPQDGSFLLTEVKGWAKPLGSEVPFFRWTGQWAKYKALGESRRIVLAGSLRAGWLKAVRGAEIPLSERFFAGGSDSVRGFARDSLGPRDPIGGEALGGTSLLIANMEGRFRVHPWVDLVLFSDAGNVWAENEDFSGRLRWTAGLGFRLRTPAGALRVEYGRKFAPLPGESSGELSFSIGEAF